MKKSLTAALAAVALLTGATTLLRQPSTRPVVVRTATAVVPEPLVTEEGGWPTTTTPTTVAPVASLATTAVVPVVVAPKPKAPKPKAATTTAVINSSTPSKDGVNCEESGCEGPDDFIWSRGTDGECRKIGKAQAEKWSVKEDKTCPGPAPTTTTTSAAPETNGTPANDDSTTTTQP